jgi:hypothetical protein
VNRQSVGCGGSHRRLISLIILTALLPLWVISACGKSTPVLKDLNGVEELKARFNKDLGKPRIVLLLSPT